MSNNFSALTPVQSGQDIRSVCSADRINAIQDLLMSLWQGENIHVGRGGSIGRGIGGVDLAFKGGKGSSGTGLDCVPFTPLVEDVADYETNPDAPPEYMISLEYGTVNGFLNPNWNMKSPISEDQYLNEIIYISMVVGTTNGQVNSVDYEYATEPWVTQDIDPVTKNTLPTVLRINMGSVYQGKGCMAVNSSIVLTPYIALREPTLGELVVGMLPYDIWWRWQVRAFR